MSTLLKNFSSTKDEHEIAKDRLNILSKELFRLGLYFQWYLFQKLAAYYVYKTKSTAYVDGYNLYISKKFLDYPNSLQLFILRHELYHIAFQHTQQLAKRLEKVTSLYERNIISIVHNIISDAVVNGIIIKEDTALGIKTPIEGFVNPGEINKLLEADVAQLGFINSVDKLLYMIKRGDVTLTVITENGQPLDIVNNEIHELLEKYNALYVVLENKNNGAKCILYLMLDNMPTTGTGTCSGNDESGGGGSGKGNEKEKQGQEMKKIKGSVGGGEPKTPEDISKLIREAIDFDNFKKITSGDKSAGLGRLPASDYLLDNVTVKKPEWEALLTSTLTSFISRYAVVSWHFINRKAPFEKPGIRYMSAPDIHILLDVSGSMLDGTLERALSRIVYIADNYPDVKIVLYQWSDGVSLPQQIDKKFAENIKKYKKIRIETGGTVIEPALDLALSKVSAKDAVVVLTDGYIYDIDKSSVIEKFKKLAQRAGIVIFASLGYIPETLPHQVKKIRLED